jgi:glycine betaine catabolism B
MQNDAMDNNLEKIFMLAAQRTEKFENAAVEINLEDPVKKLSQSLHPEELLLKITAISDETDTVRTYRLAGADRNLPLPLFRAGQYLSLKVEVGAVAITRPYSISSEPDHPDDCYEITVRWKAGGFLTDHILRKWEVGTLVKATGPHGNFYYEPLRDKNMVVAIAGGSGITPFRSLIRNTIKEKSGLKILLLYGSRREEEIIFKEELASLAEKNPGLLTVVHIISEESDLWPGRRGFIDQKLIEEMVEEPNHCSYFICGPREMLDFCRKELNNLGIPESQIRSELSGTPGEVNREEDYPKQVAGKVFSISYSYRCREGVIQAKASETVLAALERAGLDPDSQCRSGECGFCRSLLLEGEVYILKDGDGRRAADRKYGYFHPCSSYPLSDLKLIIT